MHHRGEPPATENPEQSDNAQISIGPVMIRIIRRWQLQTTPRSDPAQVLRVSESVPCTLSPGCYGPGR